MRETDTPPRFLQYGELEGFGDQNRCQDKTLFDYIRTCPSPGQSKETWVSNWVFVLTIEANGAVSNVQLLRDGDTPMGEALIQCFCDLPPWIPATREGKPVAVEYLMRLRTCYKG